MRSARCFAVQLNSIPRKRPDRNGTVLSFTVRNKKTEDFVARDRGNTQWSAAWRVHRHFGMTFGKEDDAWDRQAWLRARHENKGEPRRPKACGNMALPRHLEDALDGGHERPRGWAVTWPCRAPHQTWPSDPGHRGPGDRRTGHDQPASWSIASTPPWFGRRLKRLVAGHFADAVTPARRPIASAITQLDIHYRPDFDISPTPTLPFLLDNAGRIPDHLHPDRGRPCGYPIPSTIRRNKEVVFPLNWPTIDRSRRARGVERSSRSTEEAAKRGETIGAESNCRHRGIADDLFDGAGLRLDCAVPQRPGLPSCPGRHPAARARTIYLRIDAATPSPVSASQAPTEAGGWLVNRAAGAARHGVRRRRSWAAAPRASPTASSPSRRPGTAPAECGGLAPGLDDLRGRRLREGEHPRPAPRATALGLAAGRHPAPSRLRWSAGSPSDHVDAATGGASAGTAGRPAHALAPYWRRRRAARIDAATRANKALPVSTVDKATALGSPAVLGQPPSNRRAGSPAAAAGPRRPRTTMSAR